MFNTIVLLSLAVGAIFYAGIVFWAGKRGYWWLAILVSMPAMMGGLLSLSMDLTAFASPIFRNFKWLVLCQLIFGVAFYWAGSARSKAANGKHGDF